MFFILRGKEPGLEKRWPFNFFWASNYFWNLANMVDLLNFSLSLEAKHCIKPGEVAFCLI